MKEIIKRAKRKVKASCSLQTILSMKENSEITKSMVLEYMSGLTVKSIQVLGSTIK